MKLETTRWLTYILIFVQLCIYSYFHVKKKYRESNNKKRFKTKAILMAIGYLSPLIAVLIRLLFLLFT